MSALPDYTPGGFAEGTYINGVYVPLSEVAVCTRCGLIRRTAAGRPNRTGLCRDCLTVEHHITKQAPEALAGFVPVVRPGGIVRFQPAPEPMSSEDRAWCEKAADAHFWAVTWPRANRNGTGEQLIDEAQRRARKVA